MSTTIEHRAAQKVKAATHRNLAEKYRPAVLAVLDHQGDLAENHVYHEWKIRRAIADAIKAGMCRKQALSHAASEVFGEDR